MKNRKPQNRFVRAIRKLLLSAFVVISFGAYVLEHGARAGESAPTPVVAQMTDAGTPASPVISSPTEAPATAAATPAGPVASSATAVPTAEATAPSAPTSTPSGGYKDGTYTGPSVDVQWGLVQVQATIQGGKLTDVQFLQYPSDRRTSQRINSQADPWLQQEAIQVQSANVDIIGGATLTSEGFQLSLQAALSRAKS